MNAIEERRSIGGIEHGQSPAQLGGGLVKAEWGNQHLGEAVADPRSPFGDGLVDRRPTSSGSNRFAIDSPLEGTGFEPSVPRNRRPSRRQYRHIWAHGAWRGANSGVTHDLSRHSQPPGTVKRWIGGQFFEPVRSPDTLGATSRMKHSIDWRSWSRLRLPWKLI